MGKLNLDKVREQEAALAREEAERSKGGKSGYLKLAEGRNVIRICPPTGDRDIFYEEVTKCFNVGPNKNVIVPPSQFDPDAEDPMIEELQRLKAGSEADKKRAKFMRMAKRIIMFAVARTIGDQDKDAEGESWQSKGPLQWDTNRTVLREILSIILDPDYGDITDADEGHDITVVYTPKTKTADGFPAWKVVPKPKPTPLGDPSWVEEDLFAKNYVLEADEPDYIRACLEGTEEAYRKARQAQREADRESGDAPAPTNSEPQRESKPPAQAKSVDSQMEEIRRKNAQAAKAAGLPAHPSAPKPPPTPTDSALLEAEFWAGVNGQTVKLSGEQIQTGYVDKGHGEKLKIMPLDQSHGWKSATEVGFVPQAGGSPPPPPPGDIRADLESALEE